MNGGFIPDVEKELYVRISRFQPLLAPRLAKRLSLLPPEQVASIVASEAALVNAIDWALAQDAQVPPPLHVPPPGVPVMPVGGPEPFCVPGTMGPLPPQAPLVAPPIVAPPLGPPPMGPSPAFGVAATPPRPVPVPVATVPSLGQPLASNVASPLTIARCVEAPSPPPMYVEEKQDNAAILANRIAVMEPDLATRILGKILDLGPSVVNECVNSDYALRNRVDAALGQIYREERRHAARALSPMLQGPGSPVATLPGTCRSLSPGTIRIPASSAVITSPNRYAAAAAAPVSPSSTPMWGLETFLSELGLSKYRILANEWAANMGAILLEEVLENQEDFADAMGLRPLERARLYRNGVEVGNRLTRHRPREVVLRDSPGPPAPRIVSSARVLSPAY